MTVLDVNEFVSGFLGSYCRYYIGIDQLGYFSVSHEWVALRQTKFLIQYRVGIQYFRLHFGLAVWFAESP